MVSMEEIKTIHEIDNDSVASSDHFSSDDSNSDEEGEPFEPSIWKKGDDLFDDDFPEMCERGFIPNNNIEDLAKQNIGTPIKCFMQIFSNSILNKIVAESIKYYHYQYAQGLIKKSDNHNSTYYIFQTHGLNITDILLYFGTIIFMGINRKPEQTDHWSNDRFNSSIFLKEHISISRYKMIKHIFHLADNAANSGKHPFYKISEFMINLTYNFRRFYSPSQCLTFDESMISYKGRAKFKFYIPSKPTKWGLKLHSLNESDSGYCLDFSLDPGKSIKKEKNYLHNLIIKMMEPYLKKYHILFADAYYTTINLFENLYLEQTGLTGMINKRRKGLPAEFVNKKSINSIEIVSNGIVMLTKFFDKKQMLCASTIYNSDPVLIENDKKKLKRQFQIVYLIIQKK